MCFPLRRIVTLNTILKIKVPKTFYCPDIIEPFLDAQRTFHRTVLKPLFCLL